MLGYKGTFVVAAALALMLVACSHTDNSSPAETEAMPESQFPTIASMSEMPNATGKMAQAAQAEASISSAKAAQVGQGVFMVGSSTSFGNVAACETANMLKGGLGVAARLDLSLCYFKYMFDIGTFGEIDVEDGNWHVLELTTGGAAPQTARAKLQVTKDENDLVESLEMFFCLYRGDDGYVQIEYAKQEVSEDQFSQRAVGHLGNFQPDDIPKMYIADTSGQLDASAAFTSKEMAVDHYDNDVGLLIDSTLTQSPGSFLVSGVRLWGQKDDAYKVAIDGGGEMLGDAFPGVELSMGDGSASYAQYDQAGGLLASAIESWLGDDLSNVDPASAGPYYGDAAAGTLPSIPESMPTLAFAEGERWDCSDDVGVGIVEIDGPSDAELNTACDAYNYGLSTFSCQSGGGEDICDASSSLCTIPPIVGAGLENVCKDCFPAGEPDENTLQCLLDDVCMGEPDCSEGLTMACAPVETRCVMDDVCNGDTVCEACFPDDEMDEDTFTCLTGLCNGKQACLMQMIIFCSSP